LGFKLAKIGIISGGSFGTAISYAINDDNKVTLHIRKDSTYKGKRLIDIIKEERVNIKYADNRVLKKNVDVSSDEIGILRDSDISIITLPAQSIAGMFNKKIHLPSECIVVSCSKGLVVDGDKYHVSEILEDKLGVANDKIGVMFGPNFAKQLVKNVPSSGVCAFKDVDIADYVVGVFDKNILNLKTSTEVKSLEYFAAIKNVISIILGIYDTWEKELNFESNTRAALASKCLSEIVELGQKLGYNPIVFFTYAGFGDLFLTAQKGSESRNLKIGQEIKEMESKLLSRFIPNYLQLSRQKKGENGVFSKFKREKLELAEGIYTLKKIISLADSNNMRMPITNLGYQVLYKNLNSKKAVFDMVYK